MELDVHTATMVSNLVNLDGGVQVPHADHRREAPWQLICATAPEDLPPLRPGGSPFIVEKTTVAQMIRKAGVDSTNFRAVDISSGTGYPRWKAVLRKRRSNFQPEDDVPIDQLIRSQAESELTRLYSLVDEVRRARWQIAKEDRSFEFAQSFLEEMGVGDDLLAPVAGD